MKLFLRGIAMLLVTVAILSLVACGFGNKGNDTTKNTTKDTTKNPMLDTTTDDTTRPMDPIRPDDTTQDNTSDTSDNPMDTSDTTEEPTGTVENPMEMLEAALKKVASLPNVREGRITSTATLGEKTNESITNLRLARKEKDFVCHTSSADMDGSTLTVVGNTVYVQIGDILKEKATFTDEQYKTVVYNGSHSVPDALCADSFMEIEGKRGADGIVTLICRGVVEDDVDKLEKLLNTVNVDISEIAEAFITTFRIDSEGRILSEHSEVSASIGHAVRTTENHTVEIRMSIDLDYTYPEDLTVNAPADAESYREVNLNELFA